MSALDSEIRQKRTEEVTIQAEIEARKHQTPESQQQQQQPVQGLAAAQRLVSEQERKGQNLEQQKKAAATRIGGAP